MREAGQDRQDGREACRAGGRQNKEGTKGGRQDRSQCREAGQEGGRIRKAFLSLLPKPFFA